MQTNLRHHRSWALWAVVQGDCLQQRGAPSEPRVRNQAEKQDWCGGVIGNTEQSPWQRKWAWWRDWTNGCSVCVCVFDIFIVLISTLSICIKGEWLTNEPNLRTLPQRGTCLNFRDLPCGPLHFRDVSLKRCDWGIDLWVNYNNNSFYPCVYASKSKYRAFSTCFQISWFYFAFDSIFKNDLKFMLFQNQISTMKCIPRALLLFGTLSPEVTIQSVSNLGLRLFSSISPFLKQFIFGVWLCSLWLHLDTCCDHPAEGRIPPSLPPLVTAVLVCRCQRGLSCALRWVADFAHYYYPMHKDWTFVRK